MEEQRLPVSTRQLALTLTVEQWEELERFARENGWTLRKQAEFVLSSYYPPADTAAELDWSI